MCRELSQERHIAQLLDVRTNRQIIVKLLTLVCLKIHKNERVGLAAASRDRSNLPSNVFVCLDHFEDKYFDKSWDLQKPAFLH